MKTFDGYKKRALTDSNLLLAAGGDKPLSDFVGSVDWDTTNKKLTYTPIGSSTTTDIVTLSTIGSSFSSTIPAAYATNSDQLDGKHASDFILSSSYAYDRVNFEKTIYKNRWERVCRIAALNAADGCSCILSIGDHSGSHVLNNIYLVTVTYNALCHIVQLSGNSDYKTKFRVLYDSYSSYMYIDIYGSISADTTKYRFNVVNLWHSEIKYDYNENAVDTSITTNNKEFESTTGYNSLIQAGYFKGDLLGTSNYASALGTSTASYSYTSLNTALSNKAATNQTMYIGTTGVTINRASAALDLASVNIDGSAGSIKCVRANLDVAYKQNHLKYYISADCSAGHGDSYILALSTGLLDNYIALLAIDCDKTWKMAIRQITGNAWGDWATFWNDKVHPTTVSGYGITDTFKIKIFDNKVTTDEIDANKFTDGGTYYTTSFDFNSVSSPFKDLLNPLTNFSKSTNPNGSFGLLTLKHSSYQTLLVTYYNDPHLYSRTRYAANTWTPWKTMAFTDDNITGTSAGLTSALTLDTVAKVNAFAPSLGGLRTGYVRGGLFTDLPSDGTIISTALGSPTWIHLVFLDDASYSIKHRVTDTNGTWTDRNWVAIIDSNNYTSYINSTNFPILGYSANNFITTSGGTISNASFSPFTIERTGGAYAAVIAFKNTNGILGYVGLTGIANGALQRYETDTSKVYTILDSGNTYWGTAQTNYIPLTVKNVTNNISLNGHTHNYLPTSGGTISNSDNHVPLVILGTLYYGAIKLSTKDSGHYRTFGIRNDGELFVTNANGWANEYKIYHEGNKPTYSDVGAAAAYHTHILGGRNLLAGTTMDEKTFTLTGGSYEDKMSWTTTIPLFGYKYVLSFWAKSTVDKDSIRAHFYSPNTTTSYKTSWGGSGTASDGNCTITLSTSWERYWICYDLTRTEAKKSVILPRLMKGNVQGTISIKGVKFEMGEFPTDWSPAPEDLTKTLTFTGYSTSTYDGTGAVTVAIPNNTNLLTNGANFITASSDITGNAATSSSLKMKGFSTAGDQDKCADAGNGTFQVTCMTGNASIKQTDGSTADGGDGYIMNFRLGDKQITQVFVDLDPTYKMSIRGRYTNQEWKDWKRIWNDAIHPTTISGYGITDAMTTAHAANGITSTKISNWDTAYGWGNHSGKYYNLTSYAKTDGSKDCNNFTSDGVYTFKYDFNSSSNTLSNKPENVNIDGGCSILTVNHGYSNQIFFTYGDDNHLWVRGQSWRSGGSANYWNSWSKIALTSDIPTKSSWNYDDVYLKLSGGTIDGSSSYTPLVVKNSATETWIKFQDKNGSCYIGGNGGVPSIYLGSGGNKVIYHSGNANLSTVNWTAGTLTASKIWTTQINTPNDGYALLTIDGSNNTTLAAQAGTTYIRSGNTDLLHRKNGTDYKIFDASHTIPITNGGTGATTASSARTNLGIDGVRTTFCSRSVNKGTWALAFKVGLRDSGGGVGFIVTVFNHSGGYVVNATFLVLTCFSGRHSIILLGSNCYNPVKFRITYGSTYPGDLYFEIYANGSADSLTYGFSIKNLWDTAITTTFDSYTFTPTSSLKLVEYTSTGSSYTSPIKADNFVGNLVGNANTATKADMLALSAGTDGNNCFPGTPAGGKLYYCNNGQGFSGGDCYIFGMNHANGTWVTLLAVDLDPTYKMGVRHRKNDGTWLDWVNIWTDKVHPTTLSGYGITDTVLTSWNVGGNALIFSMTGTKSYSTSPTSINAGPDGASTSSTNLCIGSWCGIGFYNTCSAGNDNNRTTFGNNSIYFNVRNGDGTFHGNLTGLAVFASSDIRLKKDIINESKSIRSFRWKDTNEKSYGLIAQELEELGYSELVSTKSDGYKTVNYNSAICLILSLVENQTDKNTSEIEKLKTRVKELEELINQLKNR